MIKEYTNCRKTAQEISEMIGCCYKTILRAVHKYGIKINSKKKFNTLTKQFLTQEYKVEKKSAVMIAKKVGCSEPLIRNYLRKFSIKIRNSSEVRKLLTLNHGCGHNYWRGKKNPEQSKRMKGNKYGYIDGKSNEPYPLEFNNQLKESIRKRDNYICQKCEITEEEHLIVYGEILSIHHIDYNSYNLDETNLITLCRSCNSRVNYNRIYWENYFNNKLGEKCQI